MMEKGQQTQDGKVARCYLDFGGSRNKHFVFFHTNTGSVVVGSIMTLLLSPLVLVVMVVPWGINVYVWSSFINVVSNLDAWYDRTIRMRFPWNRDTKHNEDLDLEPIGQLGKANYHYVLDEDEAPPLPFAEYYAVVVIKGETQSAEIFSSQRAAVQYAEDFGILDRPDEVIIHRVGPQFNTGGRSFSLTNVVQTEPVDD
jgi:hypothetical protein